MSETDATHVTKWEFRFVALGLVVLLVVVILLLVSLHRKNAAQPTTPPDTPILVRGGAMTVFTADGNGWQGSGPYCTNADISQIVFANQATGSSTSWLKLTAPWKLVVESNHSGSGLQFVSQQNGCQGETNVTSVMVGAVNGGFYPSRLPSDGIHKDNLRFWDNTPGCSKRNDEEFCERMSTVTFSVANPGPPPPCKDGDCSIVIGK